jgi:exosortase
MGPARAWLAGTFVVAGFAVLYWPVITRLVNAWWTDDNYSHGFLIVPVAAYLTWERRARLLRTPLRPSLFGLVVVAGSILLLVAGLLGAELFTTRLSIVGTLVGTVLFLFGWQQLRALAFPLAFLLLMIPVPAIIFNQLAFPLQLFASQLGEATLRAVDVPVLREGNVLILANTSLEVAEACSGIRSLVSLITLAIVFGYFTDSRAWVRAVIVLAAIPVAVFTNGARVSGTGIAAHYIGPATAQGFFHEFSGWLMFVLAFALLIGIQRLIGCLVPCRVRASAATGAAA